MLNSPSLVNFVHIKRIVLKNNGYLLLLKFAILCRLIIFSNSTVVDNDLFLCYVIFGITDLSRNIILRFINYADFIRAGKLFKKFQDNI